MMRLTYTLTENDFLQQQLYIASKSRRIKQQRLRSWLILSGIFLVFALLFYQQAEKFMAYCLAITGIITFCFYPLFEKHQYKKHYLKFIKDTYRNRFGKTANLQFTPDCIETSDESGESRINLKEIENVSETRDYFYLKLRTGLNLVIPKQKAVDTESLRLELKAICSRLSIEFSEDLNWRWK